MIGADIAASRFRFASLPLEDGRASDAAAPSTAVAQGELRALPEGRSFPALDHQPDLCAPFGVCDASSVPLHVEDDTALPLLSLLRSCIFLLTAIVTSTVWIAMPSLTYRSLRCSSEHPYGHHVAQPPKSFRIGSLSVRTSERTGYVRTSATAAVPAKFTAVVLLEQPALEVELSVLVEEGGFPRAESLLIRATNKVALNSTTLRQVLLDQLLRAAIAEASVPAIDRADIAPGAFQLEGGNEKTAWLGAAPGTTERVQLVADIYNRSVAAGSRAPTQAVAETVGISRPQASRYIKTARELGLIQPASASSTPSTTPVPPTEELITLHTSAGTPIATYRRLPSADTKDGAE